MNNIKAKLGIGLLIVALLTGVVLTAIFCRNYNKPEPTENITDTFTTTSAPAISVEPIVKKKPAVTTVPETTSVSVDTEGTTIQIQTNAPVTAPPTTTTKKVEPTPVKPATTTKTPTQTDSNGLPTSAVGGAEATGKDGKTYIYNELDGWMETGDSGEGLTLSPELQAELDAHPEWETEIVGQ